MHVKPISATRAAAAASDASSTDDVVYGADAHFADEVRDLDKALPGWDRRGRIATARRLMTQGLSQEDARGIYGNAVVDAALASDLIPVRGHVAA